MGQAGLSAVLTERVMVMSHVVTGGSRLLNVQIEFEAIMPRVVPLETRAN